MFSNGCVDLRHVSQMGLKSFRFGVGGRYVLGGGFSDGS